MKKRNQPQRTNRNWDRRQFGAALVGGVAGYFAMGRQQVQAALSPLGEGIDYGLVTYMWGADWDLPTLIANCETAGVSAVELRVEHAHAVDLTLSEAQREEVRRRFEASKVALLGMGTNFEFHSPDPAELKKNLEGAKAFLKLSHDVGGSGVKVKPNQLPKDVPVEKTLEQIGRSLRELAEFAAGLGQKLFLEVHGSGTSLLPHIRKIMDVANHPHAGVCWNSNATDLAGEGFAHNFNLVKEKILTVHMRDLFLEDYPFRQLLRALTDSGYSGFCFAEIPASTDPVRVMRYYRALWLSYQGLL